MKTGTESTRVWQYPIAIAIALAVVKLLLFLISGNGYGYFRDELYFLACTEHIAWGYPDHAPLSVFIAKVSRDLFGDSLYAIRLFPALSGAFKIILTALIVREFGGRWFATLLACFCILSAPFYLASDNLLAMNTYEPIFWMGCALAYIWAVKREEPRYWLLFGAFAGLGVMNKHSAAFFCIAIVIGLVLTRDRVHFKSPYLWLGALIAAILFLPNLIWQYQNDWATIELLRNVQSTGKNVVLSPLEFISQQVLIMMPLTAPVWLTGVWYLLFASDGKRFRTLGIAYIVLLIIMIALKAKNYYLAPIYPVLFAAGGVWWEALSDRFRFGRVMGLAYAGSIVIAGAILLPLALPVLPVDRFIAYQEKIGIKPPKTEVGHSGPLPQHFGDMFGWPEMVEKVAGVYHSLPPEERERVAIYASNYGEAGAVDHYGPAFGLPKAISPHQSYFMWGPRDYDGSVIILLGSEKSEAAEMCESVEERDKVGVSYAMADEHFDILVCRGLKAPLPLIWKDLKHWN